MRKTNKRFYKCIILITAMLMMIPISANAEQKINSVKAGQEIDSVKSEQETDGVKAEQEIDSVNTEQETDSVNAEQETDSVSAEQETDIAQILKEFQIEDNPIDNSMIMGNTSIIGDGMDTLENALYTIFMEPAVSDYYDKICPLFEKSNISGIQMFIEGQQIDFSKYDNVNPVKVNGRVLVPLRAVGENLGAEVDWKAKERLISLKLNDELVEITVDSKTAKVNGKNATLDVPAKIIDGRTLVPIRFISESFLKTVEWHPYNEDLGVVAIY